jgi:hypothetical protein
MCNSTIVPSIELFRAVRICIQAPAGWFKDKRNKCLVEDRTHRAVTKQALERPTSRPRVWLSNAMKWDGIGPSLQGDRSHLRTSDSRKSGKEKRKPQLRGRLPGHSGGSQSALKSGATRREQRAKQSEALPENIHEKSMIAGCGSPEER